MTDLETRIPKRIEDELDDTFAPTGLLVRQEEQEIDVGAGRQRAATIAADGNDGDAFGLRRVGGAIELAQGVIIERMDDLILRAPP
jgi:hypothetical protein